jgi:hypothetical protein
MASVVPDGSPTTESLDCGSATPIPTFPHLFTLIPKSTPLPVVKLPIILLSETMFKNCPVETPNDEFLLRDRFAFALLRCSAA